MLRHSIGDCAGLPFDLESWQAFAIYSLFGWKRDADESRRFRKFFWSMARKNGKSTIAAGLALFFAMMDRNPITGKPEDVAEVILSATKKDQVEKVIYAEIERMRLKSPRIAKMSSRINRQITFKHNNGIIRCVGSDKPYDGLNPHAVLMDELHAWREYHRKFYDTMQTGSGYRRQPMIGTVTTAGDDSSHLWHDEYKYAQAVLDGTVKDEWMFAYIFELDDNDDPLDEANWIKANPNLGVSVRMEFLQQQAGEAATRSLSLNRFVRYHGNRAVSSTEKAFDMPLWDACEGTLSDWSKADAIGYGVDLGSRDDLSAWAAVARFPIDGAKPDSEDDKTVWRYEIASWAYIDEESERDLAKQPFAEWCYSELIRKCKYPTTELQNDLTRHVYDNYGNEIAADPANAMQLLENLKQEGLVAVPMRQNHGHFNEPIRDFLQAIRSGRVTHNGNPVLRWCVSNAILSIGRNEEVMFDKATSDEKIDVAVAVVMAFRVVSRAQSRATGSLYLS